MKKRLPVILVIVAVIAIALIYIFTRHTHTFAEATCTTAKTCECGEIEGEPLGHTWVDATCTTAKTCSVCNLTEGTPLEHQWIEATTENPKTCKLCGTTEGEPLPTKQGTVEGYVATEETTTEEVLTGDEITLEDIPDDIKALEDEINKQIQTNEHGKPISSYAGTTSKHDWTYPDDYSESGNRFIDRRGHIERRFDKGLMTEGQYKDAIEFLEKVQGDADDYDGEGTTMEDAAKAIAEATKPDTGEGSNTPGGSGDGVTVTLEEGPEYIPDGILCY